ncbi:MAG: YebC/PmpR family DNA-binding regulatory protein [Pseudohongiellaceae bacterium]
MAGHSNWANIKHRKAGQDAKRGKVFTKLIRELTVAAKLGGGIVADNPRLRGAGTGDNDNLEELVYEGYGPNGIAILLETLSDNKNRTVAAVRHCFSKNGGNLGTNGSVAYLFSTTGVISYERGVDEEKLLDLALEAGADDIINSDDDSVDVYTFFESFGQVKDALDNAGLESANAEVPMLASTEVDLRLEDAEKRMNMITQLEDLDDVQNVYSNASISNKLMAQFAAES